MSTSNELQQATCSADSRKYCNAMVFKSHICPSPFCTYESFTWPSELRCTTKKTAALKASMAFVKHGTSSTNLVMDRHCTRAFRGTLCSGSLRQGLCCSGTSQRMEKRFAWPPEAPMSLSTL